MELATIFENIPDVQPDITTVDDILATHPFLTINSPYTYYLYLSINKNLPETDIKLVHSIIEKLKKLETETNKKNLAQLKDRDVSPL